MKKIGKVVVFLAVYAGICVLFLGVPEYIVESKIKEEIQIYQINYGLFGGEAFAIILAVVYMFSLWLPNYFDEFPGKRYELKVKILGTLGSLLLLCAISVFYGQWYDVYTLDGVFVKRCFKEKQYDWDAVSYYTIGTNGLSLSMKLYFSDGKKTDVFGNDWTSGVMSEEYYEKFPEDWYDYALWLDKTLEQQGKELKIKDKEKLEKKLKGMDSHLRKVAQEIIRE